VEDYQMAAFLMAVVFRGMEGSELATFVEIMLHSGAVLDLGHLPAPRVDKHSTGGVGDKVSLVLAPLVAEAGLYVPMMSGRGLGHTGGTLDKLESIPGFRTDLPLDRFQAVLEAERVAMTGQTREIAPLDRRLYDLRSVTGTVASLPLIAASIMSKKLAEGLSALVLDVKVGSGAFLPDPAQAETLARTMVEIGRRHGLPTSALLTAMDRPLGRSAGNAVEVREALECLRGEGPDDLRTLVLELAAEMLHRAGGFPDAGTARTKATDLLEGGAPLERFRRMVERQGGDPRVVDDPSLLPSAAEVLPVRAERGGVVVEVLPLPLGHGVVELGGGRTRLGEPIHPEVGFDRLVQPGDEVEAGDMLARVHARTRETAERGARRVREAIRIGTHGTRPPPLIQTRVDPDGTLTFP
jgi:pyrimidine-nucleoside phosphorylase